MRLTVCYLMGISVFLLSLGILVRKSEKKRWFKRRATGFDAKSSNLDQVLLWALVNISTYSLTLLIFYRPLVSFSLSLALATVALLIPLIRKRIRARRLKKQIEIVLLQLSSSLHSNPSVSTAVRVTAKEIEMPAAAELTRTITEFDQGVSLDKALRSLAERFDSELMEIAVDALLITKETGGDSPYMMERLASIARKRQMIELKTVSMTSQPKATAVCVTIIPLIFVLGLCLLTPEYAEYLRSPIGISVLAYGSVSLSIGYVVLWRMGKILPEASRC